MTDLEQKSDDIKKKEKEKRIKKEIARIKKTYKDCDKKILEFAMPLIENVAFMTITLKDLIEEINNTGCTVEYKNGENQYGTKKSPAVETYNTMVKNHAALMKQLADLIPKPEDWERNKKDKDDGFEEFCNER